MTRENLPDGLLPLEKTLLPDRVEEVRKRLEGVFLTFSVESELLKKLSFPLQQRRLEIIKFLGRELPALGEAIEHVVNNLSEDEVNKHIEIRVEVELIELKGEIKRSGITKNSSF